MLSREERSQLIAKLLEASDGEHADDYALLQSDVTELEDEYDKQTGRCETLEQSNGALRKENFKLFSRIGKPNTKSEPELDTNEGNEDEDEGINYLEGALDEKGRWKE